MQPWMLEITAPDGARLYGAGKQFNAAWWKVGEQLAPRTEPGVSSGTCLMRAALQALAGMLMGQGLLASKTVSHPGQRAFSVVFCTEKASGGAACPLAGSSPSACTQAHGPPAVRRVLLSFKATTRWWCRSAQRCWSRRSRRARLQRRLLPLQLQQRRCMRSAALSRMRRAGCSGRFRMFAR